MVRHRDGDHLNDEYDKSVHLTFNLFLNKDQTFPRHPKWKWSRAPLDTTTWSPPERGQGLRHGHGHHELLLLKNTVSGHRRPQLWHWKSPCQPRDMAGNWPPETWRPTWPVPSRRRASRSMKRTWIPAPKSALQREVKKFLVSKALEALPPDKQPSKQEAMRMRWILSWKTDHSGTTSPKARAVVLGYQDPNYEHRITYAPTTTRHTRQLMLQMAACKNWHAWKGDVSAAFLQGRECGYDLYCIPTPELCEGMGIPKESVARLRKACYGLVQAPYEWYETVRAFLLESGFYQCATDPCCWVLQVEGRVHAIISGHVDDFMMIGDPFKINLSGGSSS